jgi:hypothetical protein
MKLPFIHRRKEGEIIRNGINWCGGDSSRFGLVTRMGPIAFGLYCYPQAPLLQSLRLRAGRCTPKRIWGLEYDFSMLALRSRNGRAISLEVIDAILEMPLGVHFEMWREGEQIICRRIR